MFKDNDNQNRLAIRKGATGRLLRTPDDKFKIIIFTSSNEVLGQGAYGKCYRGILKNSQISKLEQNQKFDFSEEINVTTSSSFSSETLRHNIVVVKQIIKSKKPQQLVRQELSYKKEVELLSLATQIPGQNDNLVRCYPFILESAKSFYLVMEYCEGKSLDSLMNKRLKSGKWFSFFEFLKIFLDLVNGYYQLNKTKIMHEDLKPENIFIKGKNFKIGDFGLSFLMRSQQKSYIRGGSQSYNGIQKYQKNPPSPSHKSDLYALGIILYKLFYGIHPYYDKSQWDRYRNRQIQKILVERHKTQAVQKVQIGFWEQVDIFVKFYESRQLKQRQPLIKKPKKDEVDNEEMSKLIQLYQNQIPLLISRLIQKDINARPTFTQLYAFITQNKLKNFFSRFQSFHGSKQKIFSDLQQDPQDTIQISIKFTQLGQKVCIEQQDQIEKEQIKLKETMLQTASRNEVKKRMLEKHFPRVLGMKKHLGDINQLSRFLMDVYTQISGHDLQAVFQSSIHTRTSLKAHLSTQETLQNANQTSQSQQKLFYQDKKIQLQFVVEKYLLSFLKHIIDESEAALKQFTQKELQVYYKENVDLLLRVLQKNKDYLESELFLVEKDFQNFKRNQEDLQRLIRDEFFKQLSLDEENILLIFFCLSILRLKDIINQKIHLFYETLHNNPLPNQIFFSNQNFLLMLEQQWHNTLRKFRSKQEKQSNQEQAMIQKYSEIKKIVIQELDKRNIKWIDFLILQD